jgi:hypothetical protein
MRRMARLPASRALGLLLALALLGTGAARGWCFMPGMRGAGPRGEHDCCKKGWAAAQPGCCLDGQAREAPATASSRPDVKATSAAVAPAVSVTPGVRLHLSQPHPDGYHSPPGRSVLRI